MIGLVALSNEAIYICNEKDVVVANRKGRRKWDRGGRQ